MSEDLPFTNHDLRSWRSLNEVLRIANEDQCEHLLGLERTGEGRLQFMNRIHGAYNKKRFARERNALIKVAKKP